MYIHRKFWFNFELRKIKIKDTTGTQNSSSAQLHWNHSTDSSYQDMHFYRKCWFDLFKVFCPIARHYCSELPFIVYSILKQCWSVGYVSLLTLSFIRWFFSFSLRTYFEMYWFLLWWCLLINRRQIIFKSWFLWMFDWQKKSSFFLQTSLWRIKHVYYFEIRKNKNFFSILWPRGLLSFKCVFLKNIFISKR